MHSRFHVSQQPKPGHYIEPWRSGAALEQQYAELVPPLRRYCEARVAMSVSGSADPGLAGGTITISGELQHEEAADLWAQFLRNINKWFRGLYLVRDGPD